MNQNAKQNAPTVQAFSAPACDWRHLVPPTTDPPDGLPVKQCIDAEAGSLQLNHHKQF